MVEPTDMALVVAIETATAHIQIMESNMRGSEDQGQREYQPDEMFFYLVAVESFAQHTVIIP